jgi:competence protein ComEC
MKKLLTLFLLLCLVLGCLGCTQPAQQQPSGQFIVHFIDLGQSDSILLEYEGHYALIDGGYAETSDKLLEYLEKEGVEKLDLVVSTHMHGDHIGGLPAVLEAYQVERLWHSRQTYYSDAFDKLLYYADQQDTLVEKPVVSQIQLLGDVYLELLGPLQKSYTDINNSSLVIMASYGKNRFLFTGDMRHEAEKELMDAGTDLKADVLKVGHHGSYTSTSYLFLRTVQPDYAVIQCGRDNEYGHPHSEPMSRLRDADVDIYRNDLLGTVIACSDGTNITFSWEFENAKPEIN